MHPLKFKTFPPTLSVHGVGGRINRKEDDPSMKIDTKTEPKTEQTVAEQPVTEQPATASSATRTAEKPRRSLRRPPEFPTGVRWLLTVGLLLCAILGMNLLCQMVGTLDFTRGRFSSYFHHPAIFLANLLPVALLIVLFYFLTNRAWLAFLLPSILLLVMEFGNYFKIAIRGDPFVAEDLLVLGEAAGVVGDYTLEFPPMFFIALALLVGGTLVLLRYARGRVPKRLWWVRVAGVVLCLAVAVLSWTCLYTDESLYEKQHNYDFFNGANEAEYRASHGFFWSFLRSVDEAILQPPEGYDEDEAAQALAQYPDADIPADKKVNVIVTMLESFSDFSTLDGVTFTQDPYEEFHALQSESYNGVMISDINGGGTVNSERSCLTGFSYPHPRYRRSSESYVRWFSEQGYSTQGGHPGFDWFYNRKNVNVNLGFDEYDFLENHFAELWTEDNAYNNSDHPDDTVFFPDRRADYLARDTSKPYFAFNLSYQGHSPYNDASLNGEEYISHDGLSDGAYYAINNYLDSVAGTGAQIAAFVDSFRDDEEPVVLLFFGDHKPSLGTGNSYYAELGVDIDENSIEGCQNLYSTPYLIWANDAAKEVLGRDFTGQGATISPCFLMTELFDCCGWEGSSWIQCQREMRDTVSVSQRLGLYVEDGAWTYTLSEEAKERSDRYACIEYYLRNSHPSTK